MLANFYLPDSNDDIVAPSTPFDGISINVLLGNSGDNEFFGESGPAYNFMIGDGGDDWMHGGGSGAFNHYYGGDGADLVSIAADASTASIHIDYYGGIVVDGAGGGKDVIGADVEKLELEGGSSYIAFSTGADLVTTQTWVPWFDGDDLALSFDWVDAYNAGLVSIVVGDYDGEGELDTAFLAEGMNTYVLLGYDRDEHSSYLVGISGDGVIYELG
ncbi:MAG: hypothetical protein V4684_19030 [Pseudomonadota bacterium]